MSGSSSLMHDGRFVLLVIFTVTQLCYFGSMLVTVYFYSRPVDLVPPEELPAMWLSRQSCSSTPCCGNSKRHHAHDVSRARQPRLPA